MAGVMGVRRYTQDDVDDIFQGQNVCGRLLEMNDGQQVCILPPGHDDGEHGHNRLNAKPTPLRAIFEPHEGIYVRVLHNDGGTRLWWRRLDRWNSDTSWFGWSWEQLMDDADKVWLAPHVDTWEAV